MSRKLQGSLFLVLGTILILAALSLYAYNRWEDHSVGRASAESLSKLLSQMEAREAIPADAAEAAAVENNAGITETDPETGEPLPPEPLSPEECLMAEANIDGNAYIGYLTIPDLELELPVISEWSYDRLKVAPCRYSGTMKGEDLILLAHNYSKHFGKLKELTEGAEITFTDIEGTVYRYEVVLQEVLAGMDVEGLTSEAYALSLFTCTVDSRSRVVIRCDRAQ